MMQKAIDKAETMITIVIGAKIEESVRFEAERSRQEHTSNSPQIPCSGVLVRTSYLRNVLAEIRGEEREWQLCGDHISLVTPQKAYILTYKDDCNNCKEHNSTTLLNC
jgi:hypothetical protein